MIKTFASYSFGCRVNAAEKEMLDRQLSVVGFQYSVNNPDIYIINTCAVTQKAEREARQLIYQTKRKWPKTKVIVTGCATTKWINEGIKVDGIDRIVDNVNKEYIAKLIMGPATRKNFAEVGKNFSAHLPNSPHPLRGIGSNTVGVLEKLASPQNSYFTGDKFLNSGRLLLKIQDGCQRFCTFCIVPYLRGQPKSVPIAKIIKMIKKASKTPARWQEGKDSWQVEESESVKEVILTAINTQAFGYDSGETLIGLISQILEKTEIPRISFGSIHPWSINDEFFKFYQSTLHYNRLIKFFHIPLQSGSNKILSLMKRGYTHKEFMEKLNTLHIIYPLSFIGTDIIVGFLEETNRDFEDTYNFLADSPISKFHVFRFSPREKTAAFYMAKRLKEPSPAKKAKRAKALIELSNKKYQQFLQKHVGKSFPALILPRRIDGYQEALLDNQIPAMIKTPKNLTGEIQQVKIEQLIKDKLYGKITG